MTKKEFIWNKLHEELKTSMEKEIVMMREILANMHQEEMALNSYDKTAWAHVVEERVQMIMLLSDLRTNRMEATKKLESLVAWEKKDEEIPLEQLLPSMDDNSLEILSMRDQMMALVDRLNSQHTRNEQLYNQVERRLDIPRPSPYARAPESAPQPQKKKASLATYPRKTVN